MEASIFLILIITGPIFIIMGLITLFFPPKKINSIYGYRTSNSMKSKDRWDIAQKYAAKEMIKAGLILILLSLTGLVFKPSEAIQLIIGLGILILVVIIMIYRVETAINKKFK